MARSFRTPQSRHMAVGRSLRAVLGCGSSSGSGSINISASSRCRPDVLGAGWPGRSYHHGPGAGRGPGCRPRASRTASTAAVPSAWRPGADGTRETHRHGAGETVPAAPSPKHADGDRTVNHGQGRHSPGRPSLRFSFPERQAPAHGPAEQHALAVIHGQASATIRSMVAVQVATVIAGNLDLVPVGGHQTVAFLAALSASRARSAPDLPVAFSCGVAGVVSPVGVQAAGCTGG